MNNIKVKNIYTYFLPVQRSEHTIFYSENCDSISTRIDEIFRLPSGFWLWRCRFNEEIFYITCISYLHIEINYYEMNYSALSKNFKIFVNL